MNIYRNYTKVLLLTICLIIVISCKSGVTLGEVEKPAKQQFKERLKSYESDELYTSWPEIKKQAVENDKFYYNNTTKIKKRVIDSLKLLNEKNFIIVDTEKDYNGRRVDWSYFFFKNKIISAGYGQQDYMKNGEPYAKFVPSIEEETMENLRKNGKEAGVVYNYFNKDSFENISGPISFGTYAFINVTVVINEKVGYYTVAPDSTGYKVTRRM